MKKFSILLVGISLFTGITQAQAQTLTPTHGGYHAGGTPNSQYYTGGGYVAGGSPTHGGGYLVPTTPQTGGGYIAPTAPQTGGGYYAPTPAPGTVASIYSMPGTTYPTGVATSLTREHIMAQQRAALEAQNIDLVTQALQHRGQIISNTHGLMTASQDTQDGTVRTGYEDQKAALEDAYRLKARRAALAGGATPGTTISIP